MAGESFSGGVILTYDTGTPTCEAPSNGVVEISLLPLCSGDTSILTRSSYGEAVSTLHCALENGAYLHVNERQKI